MSNTEHGHEVGEQLVKQDVITKEDLSKAKAREAKSGTPWFKQLIQMGKLTFDAAEDLLRYEVHFSSKTDSAGGNSLGDALVKNGVLAEADLKEALAEQKRTGRLLGRILVERNFVSKKDISLVLSAQYEIEYVDLDDTPSDAEALDVVHESMAKKNKFIPVSLEGDRLTVLISTPQTKNRLESVGLLLNKRVHPLLTAVENIDAEISKRYAAIQSGGPPKKKPKKKADPKKTKKTTEAKAATEKGKKIVEATTENNDALRFDEIAKEASGTSVVKMVSAIIEGAVNSGATDIHLDPQDPEMRVRYRIDGVLHDIMSIPETMQGAVISRIKIMSDLDITETRHPQDGHISMDIGDAEFDVRVASLPTFLGERVVMRLLDQSSVLNGIADLGLEKDDLVKVQRLIDQPYGMVLVTGPTGSGKTTTLYASLNEKNVMTDSIVTLEDPVEYQLPGINQVQIDNEIEVTFANVLRASLRQDIDVLLVGEIRDQETARIAIRAAMTGHLVFSTLHTNDAPEAISTLRNMEIPAYLISSALTAIIGQRLIRTICSDCKTSFTPTPAQLKSIGLTAATKKLYRGKGCSNCYNTGNRGRTGIFEVLEITPQVRASINKEAGPEQITKTSKLKTMAMRCRQKVKNGEINPEEFLRVIRT
jgi:type IV pilus assembly protein PilB